MGFFKKLFGTKSDEKLQETKIIYKSEMLDFIDSAIFDLNRQLKKASPMDFKNLSMIHISLMQAYFVSRDTNSDCFDLSIHHAKEALKSLVTELGEQAITIEFEVMDWDVCDQFSNTDLIKHLTLKSQDCAIKLLVLANFSGFLQRSGKWKEANKNFLILNELKNSELKI